MIGYWGKDIVFETNDSRILTFRDFSRKISGEWASHSRLRSKDKSEFLRAGLQEVTYTIQLSAMHGVRPRTTMDALARCAEEGIVNILVIGNRRVGNYRFCITDISETWDVVLNRGELVTAKLDLTMKEYL